MTSAADDDLRALVYNEGGNTVDEELDELYGAVHRFDVDGQDNDFDDEDQLYGDERLAAAFAAVKPEPPATVIKNLKAITKKTFQKLSLEAVFRKFCDEAAQYLLDHFLTRNSGHKVVQCSFVASMNRLSPGKAQQVGFSIDSDSANPPKQPNPHIGLEIHTKPEMSPLDPNRNTDPTYEPWMQGTRVLKEHGDLTAALPYVRGDGAFTQSLDAEANPQPPAGYVVTYWVRVAN